MVVKGAGRETPNGEEESSILSSHDMVGSEGCLKGNTWRAEKKGKRQERKPEERGKDA